MSKHLTGHQHMADVLKILVVFTISYSTYLTLEF